MKLLKTRRWGLIAAALLLGGCGTSMRQVMETCDSASTFDLYAVCIKGIYAKEGSRPNAASVKAFYASLDSLTELYADKKISNAQARAAAYQAFVLTVQADNDRRAAAFEAAMGGLAGMPQGQAQPSLLNNPTRTTCTRSGNTVNCTSF